MFSSCYSKKYCIFVEDKLHSAILKASFHCARLHYLCRKKAASQQSEQAPLRSVCTFFACEGRLFSESADRLHNGFLLLHPDCNS